MKPAIQKVKDMLKYHLVDSTAMLVESTPIFAALETFGAEMRADISMNIRGFATVSAYAGIGWAFGKGRDASRRIFNITDKTRESMQQFHDAMYTGAFNLVASPIFYYASGGRDFAEMAAGTMGAIALGAINGGPMGYSIDLLRDLACVQKSERIPLIVSNLDKRIKLGLAGLLAAASLQATAFAYELNNKTGFSVKQYLEQVIKRD